jgi:hypothetical protein
MSINSLSPSLPNEDSSASTGAKPSAGRARPWKIVAKEVSGEQDPSKLTKLVVELIQALDDQAIGGSPSRINPHDQPNERGNGSGSLEKH